MDNTRRNYLSGRLSDKDILFDMLNTEKQLSHLYEQSIMEAGTLEIRNIMEEFQRDEHENSYSIFNIMKQRGWYSQSGKNNRQQWDYERTQNQRIRMGRKRSYSLSDESKLSNQSQFFS